MAKYETIIIDEFEQVVAHLEDYIRDSGLSINLVDKSDYSSANTNIAVRVYDKYFMRNGNRASLNLTVVGHDRDVFISAIGAGGGQGIIFNYSLGAEEDMVDIVRQCIQRI